MPELPEVETVVRGLRQVLLGRQVTGVQFFREDLRKMIPQQKIRQILTDGPIVEVARRSKYIVIRSERGYVLSHLGMTGNYQRSANPVSTVSHTHVTLEIDSGRDYLHYIDPRRFGVLTGEFGNDWANDDSLANLGPEPLDCPNLAGHLQQRAKGLSCPVKNFLMDARHVVGIGNIYACEVLFQSAIHPLRQSGSLAPSEWGTVAEAIREVLSKAIEQGGSSIRDFRLVDGRSGYFAVDLNVYGRTNQPCRSCKSPLSQLRQAGRSTFFCSYCQPEI